MKKLFVLLSLLIAVACFAACQPDSTANSQSDTSSIPAAEIVSREEDFSLILAPVHYEEGEIVESLYYKMAFLDGESYFVVQPAGEEDPMLIPVSETVIYGIDEGECTLLRVSLELEEEDELIPFSQYQMFVRLENAPHSFDDSISTEIHNN